MRSIDATELGRLKCNSAARHGFFRREGVKKPALGGLLASGPGCAYGLLIDMGHMLVALIVMATSPLRHEYVHILLKSDSRSLLRKQTMPACWSNPSPLDEVAGSAAHASAAAARANFILESSDGATRLRMAPSLRRVQSSAKSRPSHFPTQRSTAIFACSARQ